MIRIPEYLEPASRAVATPSPSGSDDQRRLARSSSRPIRSRARSTRRGGAALADGWRRGRPADEVRLVPLADGGEGTLEAIKAAATDWLELPVHARDPLGRPMRATFLRRGDDGVVELAVASGLSRVAGRRARRAGRLDVRDGAGPGRGDRPRRAPHRAGAGRQRDDRWRRGPAVRARRPFLRRQGTTWPKAAAALAGLARVDLDGRRADTRRGAADDCLGRHATHCSASSARPRRTVRRRAPTRRRSRQLEANLAHYADLLEEAAGRRGPRRARRRRGRRHDGRAARDRGPIRVVRGPAGRRGGHGADRLRRSARGPRPGADRRGPDRRADRLRQDRAGRGSERRDAGKALHLRSAAAQHRKESPRSPSWARSSCRSSEQPHDRRRGNGRRSRAAHPRRRARRATRVALGEAL